MVKCPKCGIFVEKTAKMCISCGAGVNEFTGAGDAREIEVTYEVARTKPVEIIEVVSSSTNNRWAALAKQDANNAAAMQPLQSHPAAKGGKFCAGCGKAKEGGAFCKHCGGKY